MNRRGFMALLAGAFGAGAVIERLIVKQAACHKPPEHVEQNTVQYGPSYDCFDSQPTKLIVHPSWIGTPELNHYMRTL